MSFRNKVVLVMGASSGIGATIAIEFAKEGADVAIIGRNESKLNSVEGKIASFGKTSLVIKADVCNEDDAVRCVQATVDKFGKLDILINNAGISRPGSVTDGQLIQSYDQVMTTNLRAPMQLTSLSSPHLIKTKGNIINISGVGGQHILHVPHILMSSVSKAALNHFTFGSALELASYGVRVNAVSPGPVYTDLIENSNHHRVWDDFKPETALNRISEPEEVADVVLFLASDKARGITGSIYVVDNGMLLK